MPLSDTYGRVDVADVIIWRDERQRKEIETADLERSIAKYGVLSPILLSRDFTLIAGERRLEASKRVGLKTVPFRFADELSEEERQLLEFEENVRRENLCWQDIVRTTEKIHNLFVKLHDGEWSQQKTADALILTQGTCSMYLKVARNMEEEVVRKSTTVREAFNLLDQRASRGRAEALEDLLSAPAAPSTGSPDNSPPSRAHPELLNGTTSYVEPRAATSGIVPADISILQEDFLSWAPKYTGSKFTLIHCDFPYGGEEFAGPQMTSTAFRDGGGYISTEGIFSSLCEALWDNLDRLMTNSGHLLFWYTADSLKVADLIQQFNRRAPSLSFSKFPIVWVKSDNAGVASDFRHSMRHTYEICLFATRRGHNTLRVVADSYVAPTDRRVHPSAKPYSVMRHFLSALVDGSTSILDPTSGSAAPLMAAESLGARRILGLEVNPEMVVASRAELKKFRLLNLGNKIVQGGK